MPVIFTPDVEPYLGRELLFQFDQLIRSIMEANSKIAPLTHTRENTEQQRMACVVIPQSISIALSIRELIRQGYLFGAHVLKRALIERAVMLLYIHTFPEEIERWNRGWNQHDAPSLSKMIDKLKETIKLDSNVYGKDFTKGMNALVHGKPDSAWWNMILIGQERIGHAVSKILNRPDL